MGLKKLIAIQQVHQNMEGGKTGWIWFYSIL